MIAPRRWATVWWVTFTAPRRWAAVRWMTVDSTKMVGDCPVGDS